MQIKYIYETFYQNVVEGFIQTNYCCNIFIESKCIFGSSLFTHYFISLEYNHGKHFDP